MAKKDKPKEKPLKVYGNFNDVLLASVGRFKAKRKPKANYKIGFDRLVLAG